MSYRKVLLAAASATALAVFVTARSHPIAKPASGRMEPKRAAAAN